MDKDYYEGILQLRNPTKEVIKFARDLVEKRKEVFIAKSEKVVNGFDYYLSSQKYLQVIGKALQKRFHGELKISRKLFSVKRLTSKRIYRVTVLFRLPHFSVGDIVKVRGRLIRVKNIGKKVFGVDVESGKKINVDYKDIR